MLSQEQKDRLTPEELVIAEKWEAEKELQDAIYIEIQAAIAANDMAAIMLATDKLADSAPSECEHGRHIMCGCMACEDLDKKLYPEHYAICIGCGESINTGLLENERCTDCPEK
jgi:hypothetical protein